MYLSQYGYLSPSMKNPNSGHIMSEETMAKALMEFQSFAGLNLTGEYNIHELRVSHPTVLKENHLSLTDVNEL